MKKVRKKLKKKDKIIWGIIFIVSLGGFVFSMYNIIIWFNDGNSINKQMDEVLKKIEIKEMDDTDNTEIIKPTQEIEKDNPYWDYIKMNLIDIDFADLKKVNGDIAGWIMVMGTNVNYPFVKYKDNDYYLTHALDKSYNQAGWVFADYRNNLIDDKNTIIYAHGRYDKTMFGTLRTITTNGWLNNKDNFVIKMATENENSLWQVFSVYKIPNTSDYLQTDFLNEKEFLNFINMLKDRSSYDFMVSLDENDKILTLSTCYNDDIKSVLHAKLIKKVS